MDKLQTGGREKSEILGTFFSLAFSQKENSAQPEENRAEDTRGEISKEEVYECLVNINKFKSPKPTS